VDRLQWTEEGAYLVAPGVHRIPLPLPFDGLRAVNVYAIEAGDRLVLIDSGWALANAREQLERSLAAIGAGLRDVRTFLITHLHRDHYTQAVELRQLYGTPIALGAEEKHSMELLLEGDYRALSAQLDLLATAGAQPVIQLLAEMGVGTAMDLGYEAPDEWIISGQELNLGTRTLEAIATPGHTRGHVVFVDAAAGLLFAGDHVLPHITPSIGFEAAPPPLPLGDYLESLNVVRRLDDLTLLPAHGPVSPSSHARIDELLVHHADRLQAIADVLRSGPLTAYHVAQAVPWTSRQRKLTELDPVNQSLAICETAFHLDLLVAQDRAGAQIADGIRLYHWNTGPTERHDT
jgi:glyoxylase-like metal-dependent hydrolase (beta-lactamase superfamily II)